MAKNTKESSNYLRQLVDCCGGTLNNLKELQEQLIKIIEVKKKHAKGASSDMVLTQTQEFLDAIANLEKINNLVLPEAINKMGDAYSLARALYAKSAATPKTVDVLGLGGHEDQGDDGNGDQTDS